VFGQDHNIAGKAAHAWNSFEGSILKLTYDNNDDGQPEINYDDELARARVQLHYIKHHCFVNGNEILNQLQSLKKIPTVIVQGQYDMVCPPQTAFDLHQALPHAEFHLIADAGHSASETGITDALIKATEAFKKI
jgi:proline iminopeptidase